MAKKKTKKTSKKDSTKKASKREPKPRKGNLASTLKNLQKTWKKTQPRKIGASVPDGSYTVSIDSAVLEESKSKSKRLQVHWCLQILDEDYAKRKVHKFSGVDSEDNLAFLQGDIETLELAIPEDINDLGDILEEASGLTLEINVRTKEEYTNVDFIELVDYDDSADDEDDEDDTDDDEDDAPKKKSKKKKDADDDEDDDDEMEEEEDDDEDDEEEEEEEVTKADVRKMDRDTLEDTIDELDLDVDPEQFKSLTKLRKAVIEEL